MDFKKEIYNSKELNDIFKKSMINISNQLKHINVEGEIVNMSKPWRNNSGISFDIQCKINKKIHKIKCKCFCNRETNIKIDNVKNYNNKTCIITCDVIVDEYYNICYKLNVKKIEFKNNESKLKKLKEECIKKNLFNNKKSINLNLFKKIAIISKENTQGYNDFNKGIINGSFIFKLFTISLEGPKTESELIKQINNINKIGDFSAIIIIRGGGDTNAISNSYDKISIYESIKNSKIPVFAAIGHDADIGDKLLITEIVDKNIGTPSKIATYLNNHTINNLRNIIENKKNNFYNIYIKKQKKNINKHFENMIKINNKNINDIIVENEKKPEEIIWYNPKNGKFSKLRCIFINEIKEENINEITFNKNLTNALREKDLNMIMELLNNNKYEKLNNYEKHIKNINDINKNIENIYNKEKKDNKYYCKKFTNTTCVKKIYNILCNYNYCLKMLNSNNKLEIENMCKFYLNL